MDKPKICNISLSCKISYFKISKYPNQNTPGVKKVAAKNLKNGYVKKM